MTRGGGPEGAIVWLRRDLRLSDNEALCEAVARGGPVFPVFVFAPDEEGRSAPGEGSRIRLHGSLLALDASLRSRGSRLLIRRGPAGKALRDLAAETGARAVFRSRLYDPDAEGRDAAVSRDLGSEGIEARALPGRLLFDPNAIRTSTGMPFRVFTPFWRRLLTSPDPGTPRPAPARIPAPSAWPGSLPVAELGLLPSADRFAGVRGAWAIGEEGAAGRLARFLDEALAAYPDARDRPGVPGTSQLSAHLHFGEVSPRQVWAAVQGRAAAGRARGDARGGESFLRQIAWREFAHHLLWHFPETREAPLRPEFARFPWREDREALSAWWHGATGYPLVDAGMRELRRTGWMHNRARMVVASFLVKHLLIPWQEGAGWFTDALADADPANNTLGWQWVAGCGADASPWFRIFNPAGQGERFDPEGAYVRRWVPELAALPDRWIHRPHEAPGEVLRAAGVVPGRTYPRPIVDHAAARARALAAYRGLRGGKPAPGGR